MQTQYSGAIPQQEMSLLIVRYTRRKHTNKHNRQSIHRGIIKHLPTSVNKLNYNKKRNVLVYPFKIVPKLKQNPYYIATNQAFNQAK